MRTFLCVVAIGGLGLLYVWQKKSEPPTATALTKTEIHTAAREASPGSTPIGQVSEHNWMKRSIDRARDVSQQARAQTKQSQDP